MADFRGAAARLLQRVIGPGLDQGEVSDYAVSVAALPFCKGRWPPTWRDPP